MFALKLVALVSVALATTVEECQEAVFQWEYENEQWTQTCEELCEYYDGEGAFLCNNQDLLACLLVLHRQQCRDYMQTTEMPTTTTTTTLYCPGEGKEEACAKVCALGDYEESGAAGVAKCVFDCYERECVPTDVFENCAEKCSVELAGSSSAADIANCVQTCVAQ